MAIHRFPEEFQARPLASCLRREALRRLVVDDSPAMMLLAIDLHQQLIQVPLSFGVDTKQLDPLLSDLRDKNRTEHTPPIADCFMAYLDATLV